jgi:hypothetical protein
VARLAAFAAVSRVLPLHIDGDRKDELLAIEKRLNEKSIGKSENSQGATWSLAVYKWDVFGFTLEKRSPAWNTVQVLEVSARRLRLKADGREILIRDVGDL